MQTHRQYLLVIFFFLLLGSTAMQSQDIPPKNEVEIQSTDNTDTLTVSVKPIIDEINEVVVDSVKTDSVQPKKETLTDVVDYYGKDYVFKIEKNKKSICIMKLTLFMVIFELMQG